MPHTSQRKFLWAVLALASAGLGGCGVTRETDGEAAAALSPIPAPDSEPASLPSAAQAFLNDRMPGVVCAGATLTAPDVLQNSSVARATALCSPNGRYVAVYQNDGNFVVYDVTKPAPNDIWSTQTQGQTATFASMDRCNFVVASGPTPWSSDTAGGSLTACALTLQDDSNLVIYQTGGTALWSSAHGKVIFPTVRSRATCNLSTGAVVAPSGCYPQAIEKCQAMADVGVAAGTVTMAIDCPAPPPALPSNCAVQLVTDVTYTPTRLPTQLPYNRLAEFRSPDGESAVFKCQYIISCQDRGTDALSFPELSGGTSPAGIPLTDAELAELQTGLDNYLNGVKAIASIQEWSWDRSRNGGTYEQQRDWAAGQCDGLWATRYGAGATLIPAVARAAATADGYCDFQATSWVSQNVVPMYFVNCSGRVPVPSAAPK